MVTLALNSVYERTVDPLGFTRLYPVVDAELLHGLQKANQLTDHTAYEILQHDHHLHVWQACGHGRVQCCGLHCIKDLEFGTLSDKLQALHMQDRNMEAVLLKVFEILGTFNAAFNAYLAPSSHGAVLSPECILPTVQGTMQANSGDWEVEHIVNKMSTALRFEYSEVEVGNLDMIVTTIICD